MTFAVVSWVPDTGSPDAGAVPVHIITDGTLVASLGAGTAATAQRATLASDDPAVTALGPLGYSFDVVVTPTVTNGPYSAGDIMGALMTFNVARANDKGIILQEIQIALKAAVTPSFLLVVFNADPSSTTKTDNAAYSLNAADTFKVRAAIPINALGGYLTDHGTPNTIRLGNLAIPMKPESGGTNVYVLLIDLTGVTLTSTGDIQVRLSGVGA